MRLHLNRRPLGGPLRAELLDSLLEKLALTQKGRLEDRRTTRSLRRRGMLLLTRLLLLLLLLLVIRTSRGRTAPSMREDVRPTLPAQNLLTKKSTSEQIFQYLND